MEGPIYVWLALFITPYMHSMNIAPVDNKSICHFTRMPSEILNHIGQFLIESDEEFITRTRAETDIPCFAQAGLFKYNVLGYCPDQTKAVLLTIPKFPSLPSVLILDITQKESADMFIELIELKSFNRDYNPILSPQYATHIALSPHASMIATVQAIPIRHSLMWAHMPPTHNYLLEIQKICTKKTIIFEIPHKAKNQCYAAENDFCQIDSVAFDWQGSRIIVHGLKHPRLSRKSVNTDTDWRPDYAKTVEHYMIFPIKIDVSDSASTAPVGEEKKSLLHDYFKHNRVCNVIK